MDDHDLVLRRPWWLGDAHWTPHFFGTQAKEMADRPSLKPKPLQVVRRKEPVFTVSRRCCGILRTRTSASGQQFANWKDPPFLIGKSPCSIAMLNYQSVYLMISPFACDFLLESPFFTCFPMVLTEPMFRNPQRNHSSHYKNGSWNYHEPITNRNICPILICALTRDYIIPSDLNS
jgi:hypothetical protein